MMRRLPRSITAPSMLAVLPIALTLSCLVVGYEPIGADPDLMYRPIKEELARSLREGRLPLWSDHFGLGTPLAAESHVAAFYPPNWAVYRLLSVPVAYRLMLAIHAIATAVATFAYARKLGITEWGSSLSAVSFSLCGFQAIHAGHEPLYHAMPYLLLCLLAADSFASTGSWKWLATLALAWGAQLTVGHFQIQLWTGILAVFTGCWRVLADRRPPWRLAGLVLAVVWGVAIAAVQIIPTRELTSVGGFHRTFAQISTYSLAPSLLANPAIPELFAASPSTDPTAFWGPLATSPAEATFYVGTIPLILALIGLVARGRTRGIAPWRVIVPVCLVVATLPRWWSFGYWMVTCVPLVGEFRCPARYTLPASLGLALLAGRGLDRSVTLGRTIAGLFIALGLAIGSFAWAFYLVDHSPIAFVLGAATIPWRLGIAASSWFVSFLLIIGWRKGWVTAGVLVAVTGLELAALFHLGPTRWGHATPIPESSPILARLASEPGVIRVAGPLENLPARVGIAPAFPYLGIPAPPPSYVLEPSRSLTESSRPDPSLMMLRMTVTHGVWRGSDRISGSEIVFESEDSVLDQILGKHEANGRTEPWKIVRYTAAWPVARVCRKRVIMPDWEHLYQRLIRTAIPDEVLYLPDQMRKTSEGPRAANTRLVSWDGSEAVIEHDGACDLVLNRPFYPGWTASVNGDMPSPVLKADAGLQAVALAGSGISRVRFTYRPTSFFAAAITSGLATAAGLGVIAIQARRKRQAN